MTHEAYTKAVDEIRNKGSQIFSITFLRRTDKVNRQGKLIAKAGDKSVVVCRMNVRDGVKGVDPTRKDRDVANRLITVFDMNAQHHKSIPVDSIIAVS